MRKKDLIRVARDLGWAEAYASNADFETVFDDMFNAVQSLSPDLEARARELAFPQLHHACLEADLEVVGALLDAGIAPDTYPCTEDEDDEPPLVWVARDEALSIEQKVQLATLLLERGASIDEGGALEHARESADEEFSAFLIRRGAVEQD